MKRISRIDPRYASFRLRAAPSRIHRWGVYALENIPANRKVIEYTGERIGRREARRRGEANGFVCLFSIDDYWCKDGAVGGSGAEIINHSCDPNLRAAIVREHILYFSKRLIRKGEELTIDYQFDSHVQQHPCRCGSGNCRGTINR